jgi:hypothetical protein
MRRIQLRRSTNFIPSLRDHLDRYAEPGTDGLAFTGPRGALLRRSNFRRRVWLPALDKAWPRSISTTCAIPATS